MLLYKIVVGSFQVNCYILAEKRGGKGVIIDPGGEGELILSKVEKNDLEIIYIIATHAHIDHIGDVELVQEATRAQFLLHPLDVSFLKDPQLNLSFILESPRTFSLPHSSIQEGEKLQMGSLEIKILHTPGHTPGSICLEVDRCIFSGDTLFAGGVGRVDFPGGDFKTLQRSIRKKLLNLPPDTRILPGHGPESTVEREKRVNPFVQNGLSA